MDKKSIIGILLAVVGLISWNIHYTRQLTEYRAAEQAAREAAAAKAAEEARKQASTEIAAAPPAVTPPAPAAAVEQTVPEQLEKLSTKSVEYLFTNLGGGLHRAKLFDHLVDTTSRRNVVLNEFGSIPIGAVSEVAGEKIKEPFKVTRGHGGAIVFESLAARPALLTKKFTLPQFESLQGDDRLREEYRLRLDLTFANPGPQPIAVPAYYVHTGSAGPIHHLDQALYVGFNYFRGTTNTFIPASWFSGGGFLFFSSPPRAVYPEKPEVMTDVRWAAATNQYFATIITPIVPAQTDRATQTSLRGVGVWAKRFDLNREQWQAAGHTDALPGEPFAVDGALAMPGFTLAPGASVTRGFHLLAGPREHRRLRELNEAEDEILDFGWFALISKGLLNSLNFFNDLLGSYWAAIIALTICIRSAMWPLQNRATETAKKMQALSPKLKELQEKYKDDPMRMQQETTKMWKEYGINPLGGCLPMLVQIPIFFGFFNMLNKAVELRNSSFLWVHDLSQPDTVAHILGFPLNPLPLVMAVTMVWQMHVTPKTGDKMQQRLMMFMPLIFIAFCYNYAAALALYWTVQNLFSIVQLFITRDKGTPPPQKVAVAATVAGPMKKKR